MIKYIVVYYIYWICLVIFYLKNKKIKIKNFMIEFLNVVIDVYVIFFILNIICFLKSGFWIVVFIF